MRLNKRLANDGVASRRKSEELIKAGKVRVNGEVVTDPAQDVTESDLIEASGKTIVADNLETYALNKPKGVIATASDEKDRKTVVDLVPSRARLYPVGRLDSDSKGLLLLTNDGELANKLTHPRYEIPKVYLVTFKGALTDHAIEELKSGVQLDDGLTAPAEVKVVSKSKANSTLELTIYEGRNRQIRRMGDAIGFRVLELTRLKLGTISLGKLESGQFRQITAKELSALREYGSKKTRHL